ncbi:MAG TPA: aminotransferase class I/II-fold pyridoxal phosphate-dependent enzyme, partial [Candidatus Baltobacteraceae bacterium]
MTDDTLPVHGGNVARAAELYGGDASDYLDFSANINPLGPPERVVTYLRECAADPSRLARYPDVAYGALRRAVAAHEDIDATSVVVGNGSAALLGAAIRAVRPQSCLLPLPAFSEYAYALRAAGVRTIPFELSAAANFQIDVDDFISALKRHRPDLCIVNNPHNPSGNMLPAQSLRAIVRSAHAIDVTVLVDEAFIDYAPDESLTRDAATETNLIVIRSLTKFYAMPALRVGYAVVAPEHVRAIAAQLPSWPVSTIAADAATCAL